MKVRPLHDRSLSRDRGGGEDEEDHHSADTAKEKPIEGKVIAVEKGASKRMEKGPLEVKVGIGSCWAVSGTG